MNKKRSGIDIYNNISAGLLSDKYRPLLYLKPCYVVLMTLHSTAFKTMKNDAINNEHAWTLCDSRERYLPKETGYYIPRCPLRSACNPMKYEPSGQILYPSETRSSIWAHLVPLYYPLTPLQYSYQSLYLQRAISFIFFPFPHNKTCLRVIILFTINHKMRIQILRNILLIPWNDASWQNQ